MIKNKIQTTEGGTEPWAQPHPTPLESPTVRQHQYCALVADPEEFPAANPQNIVQ